MPTVTRTRYDALVFDLDGTLLDGRARLTDAARVQIDRARSLGFVVVIATGRSLSGAFDVHRTLGLDTEVVAYNGAWIGRPDGKDPWHYAPIPDELVSDLVAAEQRAEFLFRHRGESKFTARTGHPHHPRIARWYTNVVEVEPGPGALPHRDLMRVSLFFDNAGSTDDAWASMAEPARDRLHREVFPMAIFPEFADTGLVLCEVQRKGHGKAEALRLLAERYAIPASRVVAVGDQQNDLSMLSAAGLAVAMGNAIPAARAVCHISIGDHREDGVARWLASEMG
jgi:Cof subfamily protein (haloacid dehalogenase superfamily)